jgi:hypothetical protein
MNVDHDSLTAFPGRASLRTSPVDTSETRHAACEAMG